MTNPEIFPRHEFFSLNLEELKQKFAKLHQEVAEVRKKLDTQQQISSAGAYEDWFNNYDSLNRLFEKATDIDLAELRAQMIAFEKTTKDLLAHMIIDQAVSGETGELPVM